MDRRFGMETEKRYISLSNVICIASCFSALYLFKNPAVSLIGGCALVAIILICLCMGVADIGRRGAKINEALWAVITIYGAALVIKNPGGKAIYEWAQMSLLLFIPAILSGTRMKAKSYAAMVRAYSILFWIITITYLLITATGSITQSKSVLSPTMVKCIVPLSFFVFDFKRRGLLKVLLFAVICFVLGERTSVVVILAVYVFYCILRRRNNKALWYIIFPTVLVLAILVPFVYVWMADQAWRPALDAFFFKYTGQRFFSGRNMLWGIIINGMKDHQLMGLGFGSHLLQSHDITISTHNVYMYLYMCGGVLLALQFVIYLALMWRRYCRNRDSEMTVRMAAYFLGLIIFMDFELFMIVNNIVVSLFWWIILTMPYNVGAQQKQKRIYSGILKN